VPKAGILNLIKCPILKYLRFNGLYQTLLKLVDLWGSRQLQIRLQNACCSWQVSSRTLGFFSGISLFWSHKFPFRCSR
jgi:hypothetical protein